MKTIYATLAIIGLGVWLPAQGFAGTANSGRAAARSESDSRAAGTASGSRQRARLAPPAGKPRHTAVYKPVAGPRTTLPAPAPAYDLNLRSPSGTLSSPPYSNRADSRNALATRAGPQSERLLRLPVSRTLTPPPTQAPASRSSHPVILGGPDIYPAHNAAVLSGTGFKRRP